MKSESNQLIDERVVVGPFQCNCRILVCPETGQAALIDPGDEPQKILNRLAGLSLPQGQPIEVKFLFHTHAHLDHIGGTRGVSEGLSKALPGTPNPGSQPQIALHREDEFIYRMLRQQGQMFGIDYEDPLPITHYLEHGEEIAVGKLNFSVIHTPGHSPGSLGLRLHEDSRLGVRETVFSGDTLFQGSVGRTDLWGADGELMFKMIRERLLTLDGDTRVCPGHGPESRIGVEKLSNPFLI